MNFVIKERPGTLIVFLLLWFLAGAVQGAFMPLSGEEAYYWLFSQHLQWGYLDHPPAVAFFAYLGSLFDSTEFGARLFSSLLSTATLALLYDLLGRKHLRLFIFMTVGLLAVHAGSFLVKTDVPLLFFEVLFFWFYKRYVAHEKWVNILGVSLAVVGMLLSKYHGVLIVFFTLLSNLRLLQKRSFWAIMILSIVFMLPHIYWLYQNDWSSIVFHLNDRADISFNPANVVSYVLSQPIVLGPLVSIPLFIGLTRPIEKSTLNAALKWVFFGVLAFFLYQSFKVFIHKHWTSVVLVPLMVLAFDPVSRSERLSLWVRRLGRFSVFFFLLFRLYLSVDYLPTSISRSLEPLHDWDQWASELSTLSDGRPIVFINSYENASRYEFYSKQEAHTLSTVYFNNTQFDYWGREEAFRDQEVLLVHHKRNQPGFDTYTASNNARIYYQFIDRFSAFDKVDVKITPLSNGEYALQINNPYPFTIGQESNNRADLRYYLLEGERILKEGDVIQNLSIKSNQTVRDTVTVPGLSDKKRYHLRFGLKVQDLPPTINSNRLTISKP